MVASEWFCEALGVVGLDSTCNKGRAAIHFSVGVHHACLKSFFLISCVYGILH
jgi:hypothetical protein